MENLITEIYNFQKIYPNIYVGGSISLILQNAIPYRTPKDIDLVSPIPIHINEIFNIETRPKFKRSHKVRGILWELFINPNAKYLLLNYKGKNIKVSPVMEIFEWKKKFLSKIPNKSKTSNKHQIDIS